MKQTLARLIASTCDARRRCAETNNDHWYKKHTELLEYIEKNLLPSGGGIDSGTQIDKDKTNDRVIVLWAGYHHMNDCGYYDGWTDHTIRVKSTFIGNDITISGRDRNGIKDYLAEMYQCALNEIVEYCHETEEYVFADT